MSKWLFTAACGWAVNGNSASGCSEQLQENFFTDIFFGATIYERYYLYLYGIFYRDDAVQECFSKYVEY